SGGIFSSGFYLSNDGGVNWTKTKTGLPRDVAIDADDPQNLYLGMSRVDEAGSPPAGLYKSTDRGPTWTFNYARPFNTSFLQVRVSVANGSPQTIYALLSGQIGSNSDVRFAASTNGGATWNERPANGLKKSVWDYVAVDPSNANTVYVGVEDL